MGGGQIVTGQQDYLVKDNYQGKDAQSPAGREMQSKERILPLSTCPSERHK